jgi:hypothetical protein
MRCSGLCLHRVALERASGTLVAERTNELAASNEQLAFKTKDLERANHELIARERPEKCQELLLLFCFCRLLLLTRRGHRGDYLEGGNTGGRHSQGSRSGSTRRACQMFTKLASRSATGIGLGLYLSKKMVEVHGGSITAENNTDGKGGATIRFSIPLNLSA